MLKWIIGIIVVVIVLMVIIKLSTMNSNRSIGLDNQLDSIRRGFRGVCAKILRRVGC